MLLACVQTDIQIANVSANVSTVVETIQSLSGRNVDLVVFPECMLTGYAFDNRTDAWSASLQEDSPEIQTLVDAAAQAGLSVTIGLLLREGSRLHNASLLIDGNRRSEGRPAPAIVGKYHKVHLPYLGVDRFVDRGEIPYQAWPVTCRDGQIAQVGMGICYDSSFPEPMRALGLAGADVIALGTNWPVAASRTAEIVPPARSMENHLFFVAANRVGSEHGFDFCGLSSICGPDGVELARAVGNEFTILFAEVDLAEARNKRIERTPGKHVIDRFADRRPEFYATIVDPID